MSTAVAEDAAPQPAETAACDPCAHATAHGWWGDSLPKRCTHCRTCHRTWRSLREGHCTRCCRHFADDPAFSAHQREGRCWDPATLLKADGSPRFKLVETAFGPSWDLIGKPFDAARLAALRAP